MIHLNLLASRGARHSGAAQFCIFAPKPWIYLKVFGMPHYCQAYYRTVKVKGLEVERDN